MLERRRDILRKTMRRADAAETGGFIGEIFTDRQSHPWFQALQDFLDGREHDTFVRGEAGEGITILCSPAAYRGMWCRVGDQLQAVGLLQGRGLEIVKQIAAQMGSGDMKSSEG